MLLLDVEARLATTFVFPVRVVVPPAIKMPPPCPWPPPLPPDASFKVTRVSVNVVVPRV